MTWSQLLTQTLLPPIVAAGMLLPHSSQKGGLRPVPGLLQPEGRKGLLPAALHERAGLRHVG